MRTILERFEEKYIPEPMSGCFLWTASVNNSGYGWIGVNGKTVGAHRLSYELFIGSVPDGLCVLHKCDVRSCVNPDHLFLGTYKDNRADMIAKGRAPDMKGVNGGGAKLTEEQVLEIRVASGTHRQIASRYGIVNSLVSYIKNRKSWSHL